MTSVRVLVSYMAGVEVLVAWEYMLALKVSTLGNRRLLCLPSTGIGGGISLMKVV